MKTLSILFSIVLTACQLVVTIPAVIETVVKEKPKKHAGIDYTVTSVHSSLFEFLRQ